MKGTEKQITWAEAIRQRLLEEGVKEVTNLEKFLSECEEDEVEDKDFYSQKLSLTAAMFDAIKEYSAEAGALIELNKTTFTTLVKLAQTSGSMSRKYTRILANI